MNVDVQVDSQKVIHTYLRRVKEGVEVTVKVAPEIEEFFKYWGTGAPTPAHAYGRSWKKWPIVAGEDAAKNPLNVWGVKQFADEAGFDLISVGRTITHLGEKGQNISFIRLVGASSVDGVKFIYEDVVSSAALRATANRIQLAGELFYSQYIRPVHLEVILDIKPVVDLESQPWLRRD